MNNFNKNILLICFLFLFFGVVVISCSDDNKNIESYDPSLPVLTNSFTPDSGGIATQVILKGSNFGTDTSLVKVYFNKKKAAIISIKGDQMYVLVPRLPGDTCTVSVKIGNDSVLFTRPFYYKKGFSVTTIAGQPGSQSFQEGTLATAQFGGVQHLAVDAQNNVFVTQRNEVGPPVCSVLNEASNSVTYLFTGGDNLNVPTVDQNTQIVYVPLDPTDTYYELNPANMWISRTRMILHPSAEQQAGDPPMVDFKTIDWKHSFAFCAYDGMIYTRAYRGDLIKFDPKTRIGQLVASNLENGDSYLVFDPVNPYLLYIAYASRHCIYTFNILTKEHKLFAGSPGRPGWNDGIALDAEFNAPRQITLDSEGNLYVADENNHCIRMINKEGIVTTPIGLPGKSGYVDGNPEIALLNRPKGVSVDKDGNVYIADYGNRCIRKLTLQ